MRQTEELMKNPDKASQYERDMKEYLEEEFVEEVFHTHSQIGRTWHLPHHTIVREDKLST
ncbi:hypothetical protein T02_10471 [Trichinella nativa]|uniref:Uncharacterized protein n=1 Tax=Trichinella nativa TaxID=6335 RepID=A0A0V1KQE6_9BILA|nr:hypothetical protein T02_10471 [Trichinella nativa]